MVHVTALPSAHITVEDEQGESDQEEMNEGLANGTLENVEETMASPGTFSHGLRMVKAGFGRKQFGSWVYVLDFTRSRHVRPILSRRTLRTSEQGFSLLCPLFLTAMAAF